MEFKWIKYGVRFVACCGVAWFCLLPGRVDNAAVCLKMRRDQFVSIVNGNPFKWIQQQKKMMDGLCKWAKAEGKSAFEKMEIDVGMSYASMWMS